MVAVLAHGLAVIENTEFNGNFDPGQVALVALYHDSSEILTGDLPTPIKYDNPDIQRAYQSVEAMAEEKLLSMLPVSMQDAFAPVLSCEDERVNGLVKSADKLSAYLKCVEEVKAGNKEFLLAKQQIFESLNKNPLPSLQFFMQHLLPDFELTLDELQGEISHTNSNQ